MTQHVTGDHVSTVTAPTLAASSCVDMLICHANDQVHEAGVHCIHKLKHYKMLV